MGQIVRFPLPSAPYPDHAAELDPAERVLLIAVRWWTADQQNGTDPLPRLLDILEHTGTRDAALALDRWMSVLAWGARHPITIQCPRCPHLSGDETCLLFAASLAQAGDGHLAEKALYGTLLSIQGAEFALGPLEDIGASFAEARLVLRRRPAPRISNSILEIIAPELLSMPRQTIQ
jgi:hypothetical protein